MNMKRRIERLEKFCPNTPDLATTVEITDHTGNPHFAWVWTGQDWETVTRKDGESAEYFRERISFIERLELHPQASIESHLDALLSAVNGRTRSR
jgi:hypothetical protein